MEENLYKDTTEQIIDKRYRNFMFILYPEWHDYKDIIQNIKSNYKKWAYIEHKPETNEKKEHTHVILMLDSAIPTERICKKLGIPENLCQPIKGIRGACRYLTHIDYEDKNQYELANVKLSGGIKNTFLKAFDDLLSDDEILDRIYQFIEDNRDIMNPVEMEIELSRFISSNNYNTVFKRFYNTICKYIIYQCKKDLTKTKK